ncbi:MAG TPA: PilZ domain-containing protein [Sphingomicrobium sp.]|nr:PilZ domain-containing protein [Sphingomicrobium sp.]
MRAAPRRPVNAEVRLRRSGELNFTVDVHDLSERGCRTEFVERPRIGEIVWVKFGSLAALECTVRWVNGYQGGLEFNQPINPAVLDMIIRQMN